MAESRLLNAAEVAELLGVTERWVREAGRRGEIPSIKLGHYRRYRREAIEAWILEREAA